MVLDRSHGVMVLASPVPISLVVDITIVILFYGQEVTFPRHPVKVVTACNDPI